MNKLITFVILVFLCQNLIAQNQVNFKIQPQNATVKVDGKLIQKSNKESFVLNLDPGSHIIEIWAPEFELVKEEFFVSADQQNSYSKGLIVQSDEFKAYKAELKKYNSSKFSSILSTIGAVAGNAVMYYIIWDGGKVKDLNNLEERLEIAQRGFAQAVHPDDIQLIRTNFDQNKEDFNKQVKSLNTRRTIGIPIGVGVSTLSYLLLKKKKKREKPNYSPTNPLVLNHLNLNMSQGLALQLNFNF